MRVLVLAPQPFYQNRGTPIAVRLLAEVLGKNGIEVHLLVFHEGEEVELENVTVHRIPAVPGISSLPPGFSIKKIICDMLLWTSSLKLQWITKFDLVHAVEEAVFIARLNKVLFRVPYVYDMDSCLSDQMTARLTWLQPVRSILEWFENGAVRGSNGVLAVCTALESKVRKLDRHKELLRLEDISLLGERADTGGKGESLRDTLGIRGKIALYVGNLERYQGIDLLLEGFSLLAEIREDCALVVIGGSPEDIAGYTGKAGRLAIADRVFFIGPRPLELLGDYLCQADVLVSPRIEGENTPMKIYSYLDSGRPVLATCITSHTQVLNEDIAVLVEPDPQSLARGLDRLLGDEELCGKLAGRAKERVALEFSRPVYEKKLMCFYGNIIQQLQSQAKK
ncbi:MAG: glycosyltransferase family 4 protein [Desulfobulbaceae bacterium]|nr:glycosyltransferase family 4 protein [Desulfobulbaceae bacterium]